MYALRLLASDISFAPSDANKEKGFNATNVEDAINELYNFQHEFDESSFFIQGGASVTIASGFEVGKLYIIYIRHNSINIPTLSDVEYILPIQKVEFMNTDKINNIYVYMGIIKAKSETITISEKTVIAAKKIYK